MGTREWDRVTCKACLRDRDQIECREFLYQEENRRIGVWEVYEAGSCSDYSPDTHVRFVFGKKPKVTGNQRAVFVEDLSEVHDQIRQWERWLRNARPVAKRAWAYEAKQMYQNFIAQQLEG
jgi:hypothetical protein